MAVVRANRYCTRIGRVAASAFASMDKRLLDILVCPVTKTPLRPLGEGELAALNRAIAAGPVLTSAGAPVAAALAEGLITRDGRTIYRVDDGIPVMLSGEAIATAQLADFPGA
jgi:uncharacterized protein YbaR (Trm112 family)